MGYHKQEIDKGNLGESSKIVEELQELIDAEEQSCRILVHVELSDLYGALESCANSYGLSMEDLKQMSDLTKDAFKSGDR